MNDGPGILYGVLPYCIAWAQNHTDIAESMQSSLYLTL